MINADALNNIQNQLPPKLAKILGGQAQHRIYYDIAPQLRDDIGAALRDRLSALPATDLVAIRACIAALRSVYAC